MLYSFEDGEVFKLKKSNYSRRLAKQREKERKKKEESSSKETVSAVVEKKQIESSEPRKLVQHNSESENKSKVFFYF